MAGDRLVVREGDGGLVERPDDVQEGKVEPVGPDHAGLLGLLLVEDVDLDYGDYLFNLTAAN